MKYELLWKDKVIMMKDLENLYNSDKDQKYKVIDRNNTNILIKGDNIKALKTLQKDYFEKIKMIYIDPPYNTGRSFVYKDKFKKKGDKDKHSPWLNFMYPRLSLARNLLKDDGVIFISIDDNEQAQLKILCDEIFGEENFVNCFIWETKKGAQGMTTQSHIVANHEFILTYAKAKDNFKFLGTKRDNEGFSNPDNDERGLWKRQYLQRLDQGLPTRTIVDPNTNISYSFETPYSQEKLDTWIKENRILFPKNGEGYPARKEFLNEYKNNKQLITSLGCYATKAGTEKLYALFDDVKIFTNPKPDTLLKFLLEITDTQNSIILDFFAGSGTTAQAVMELNAEDGGNRKFILVQLPEAIDEKRSKTAYDFVKNTLGKDEPKISDITQERIIRASKQIQEKYPEYQGDLGFQVWEECEDE